MKIAIRGHASRGNEIIQILESLGGKNIHNLHGNSNSHYYLIDCGIITISYKNLLDDHKYYTLEEFEKEFPFKIGDKVIHDYNPYIGTIVDIKLDDNIPYRVNINGTICTCETKLLHLYKPMKEERNITLTLEKAKEWYKKGRELKEVALQAYSEEELTKVELPKTWEEFCDNYPVQRGECFLSLRASIEQAEYSGNRKYKNWIPSKKSAEAHLAMIQLEQLRNCYRGLFITIIGMPVWCIVRYKGNLIISHRTWGTNETFLSFQSPEIAEKYLKNFESLIKQAGDLI